MESGETARISLDLEESILLKARLIDEKTGKAPVGRAWMTVPPAGGYQTMDGAYADEAGRFQFRLPAGKFEFSYMIPGMQFPGRIEAAAIGRGAADKERIFKVKVE